MIPTRAEFYERTVIDPGAEKPYRYKVIPTYTGGWRFHLYELPAVGDVVLLGAGSYRVLSRQWLYTSYGSVTWPYNEAEPGHHSCNIIVEKCDGLFADEAELTDEEREEE